MTAMTEPDVTPTRDDPDRWWLVGPISALVVLCTVGALELLYLIIMTGTVLWFASNGFPSDWCPDKVDCSEAFSPVVALPQFLVPLAVVLLGAVLTVLAFRGPKTLGRRLRRLALSLAAAACPILAYALSWTSLGNFLR